MNARPPSAEKSSLISAPWECSTPGWLFEGILLLLPPQPPIPLLPIRFPRSHSENFGFFAGRRLSVCLSVVPHSLLALFLYYLPHAWVWHSGLLHYAPVELFDSTKTKLSPQILAGILGLTWVLSLLAPCFWAILGALALEWGVTLADVPGSGPFHISSTFLSDSVRHTGLHRRNPCFFPNKSLGLIKKKKKGKSLRKKQQEQQELEVVQRKGKQPPLQRLSLHIHHLAGPPP